VDEGKTPSFVFEGGPMKMIRIARTAAILGLACFGLQGCTAAATPTPTAALLPSATVTAAATSTRTTTAAATLLPTPSATAAQSPKPIDSPHPTNRPCEIPNGIWESDEVDTVWPMIYPMPIVYFKIQFCMIRELQVFVNVQKDIGFSYIDAEVNSMMEFGSDKNPFFSLSFDNPDGPGSVSVYGKFTSPDQCLGFIMFSKGFSLGGDPLVDPVTITYHAKPVK
jgi:hypothetical protein